MSARRLSPLRGVALGADIGATTIKAARIAPDGRVLAHVSAPTPRGATAILDVTAGLVRAMAEGSRIRRVGVGSAGLVDRHGVVRESTDTMPGWTGADIPRELRARTGLACAADNDGNVAALGEAWFGAGRGAETVAMLTLGTGVGGGLVTDRRLVHGVGSMAGTFGHLKVGGGARCACGGRGCLEAYASAWSLARALRLGAEEVFARASRGDEPCARAVARMGGALGVGLAQIAHALNPDVIVIGGGIARALPALRSTMMASFRGATLRRARTTQIRRARWPERAGVVGAAVLGTVVLGR